MSVEAYIFLQVVKVSYFLKMASKMATRKKTTTQFLLFLFIIVVK